MSTGALTPKIALAMAAIMNFVGAFLGQKVAHTVSDTIDPGVGTHGSVIVMAGLVGAIAWNLTTRYYGLPSSSSHALIGGLVGAALAAGATADWGVVIEKVVIPMLISPLVAFGLGFAVMLGIMWAFRNANPSKANRGFKIAQTISAGAMAPGHGLRDAQKTMGVIFPALLTGGYVAESDGLPLWVIMAAATAISLGTWSGGWRIMRTLGRRIIHLDPPRGFAAESVAASVLYTTAYVFEAPISTTHTITSAVMGVGATKRLSAVRWGVAKSILTARVLTFPAAALAAAVTYWVAALFLP
ncbi:inorganic phosphate transporter [Nocardioides sp. B-3]|uniref:inorganic phosphate transporter n=1 Tax=Nocardioides sp. B-3 TaxID=2895565 RepID=UPI003FA57A00